MKVFLKNNKITIALITCGIIMISIGIILGQPSSVLAKAVKICLECVGIG